jgi:outer membrane protein TolC
VAFARVIVAREVRLAAEARALAAGRVLKAIEARWKAGDVPPYDVQRSRVDAARAEHTTVEAKAEEALAMSRLNLLLGRPPRSLWVPVGETVDPRPLPALSSLREAGEARRPELLKLDAQIAQAEAAERVAVASRWPGFEWTAGGGMSNGLGVLSTEARVPFPLWYGREGEQAEAVAEQAQYRAERQALVQQVHLEVEEAYRRWQEANHELELFRESLLPASEQMVKLAEVRYKEGAGSGLELHEAHAARQETLATYWAIVLGQREAIADLERAAAVEE